MREGEREREMSRDAPVEGNSSASGPPLFAVAPKNQRQVNFSPMLVNCESRPTVRSIKKKRTDQSGEMGSLDRASGYAMNAKPNPA